jgi:hypothetical protein
MLEVLSWWSKRRNLWAWARDAYSDEDLRGLITEACDCDLHEAYNPFGELTMEQYDQRRAVMRKTVKRLMKWYGRDVWSCCLGAAGVVYNNQNFLECLSKLELASQVRDQESFEEFMVRNSLKWVSR